MEIKEENLVLNKIVILALALVSQHPSHLLLPIVTFAKLVEQSFVRIGSAGAVVADAIEAASSTSDPLVTNHSLEFSQSLLVRSYSIWWCNRGRGRDIHLLKLGGLKRSVAKTNVWL